MTISMHDEKAFTFLEIIAVVFMVAIISAIIFSRIWFSNVDLIGQTEVLKTQIRYAQSQAMNSDVIWGIRCTGSSYWLFKDGNINSTVLLPGEESDTVALADKEISSVEVFTISFDDRGIPHTDAGATDGQELISSDPEAQITVTSKGETLAITITPNTGFIP
jgi:type II secretory pathway pseudopilin PulG